jgi:hypothetical protein
MALFWCFFLKKIANARIINMLPVTAGRVRNSGTVGVCEGDAVGVVVSVSVGKVMVGSGNRMPRDRACVVHQQQR